MAGSEVIDAGVLTEALDAWRGDVPDADVANIERNLREMQVAIALHDSRMAAHLLMNALGYAYSAGKSNPYDKQ